jgi:hypothetical protein
MTTSIVYCHLVVRDIFQRRSKMKIRYSFVILALLVATFTFAQMPTGQWYVIHSEVVKPSMVKEYEASSISFAEFVRKNQTVMPHLKYMALQSEDFVYSYVVPISKMADMDAINAGFQAAMSGPTGPEFMKLMSQNSGTYEYTKEWVVGEAPELSYVPATPRLKPEEERFFHLDIYYVKQDKMEEAAKLAGEVAELFKKKNIPNGYKVFMPVMGPEMPAFIVRAGAKDAADYYAETAKNAPILGPEFKALMDRAMSLTRRFETRTNWLRPDLSNLPSPPAKQ